MTLGEAKELAFRYINEYSSGGIPISTSDGNYVDIKYRMYGPANTAQMRLATIVRIPALYSISQNTIENLLGTYSFSEAQHFPDQPDYYQAIGAKSFSIEVDGTCTLLFEELVSGVWTRLNGTYSVNGGTPASLTGGSISVNVASYTNYRGLLTIASANNPVRITVAATYPMKSRYRALFKYPYATADKVPWYRAYVPYSLPSDYYMFNKMMRAYDERQFTENKDYILMSDKKIYLNWSLDGSFDIYYWKYPTEITVNTPDSYEFEVSKECQALIPWFMGGQAIMPDDSSIGTQLINQYYAMESQLIEEIPETQEEITDEDGW